MKNNKFEKINDYIVIRTGDKKSCYINQKSTPFIYFPALERTNIVTAAFSTRLGGVSRHHLSSLNLSFDRGDNPENVLENYNRICSAIGIDYKNIVATKQTHTTNVIRVSAADKGKGIIRARDYDNVDGLITNEPGVILHTTFADCVPLYIVDPVNKAIGLIHSGWRGTLGRIGFNALQKMKSEFGTNPYEVVVQIGPSICRDCYEVSQDVAMQFIKEFPQNVDDILVNKSNGKYLLDLWKACYTVFADAGVKPENIHLPDICTCHNSNWLFSHRASHGKRGNLSAFLMLNN
ncbi:MAG: peptidoglycan editing factor PgeF [Eubacterium sp.]